jgi:hypothetical protein
VLVIRNPLEDKAYRRCIPFRIHTFTEVHHPWSHASFLVLFPSDCFRAILRQKSNKEQQNGLIKEVGKKKKKAKQAANFL